MSLADKLTEVAENVPKVFEAGKQAAYDRFWDVVQDGGNRNDYNVAFSGRGWNVDTFKPKYDLTIMSGCNRMFYQFNYDMRYPLVDLVELLDALGVNLVFGENIATCYQCFHSARISRIGVVDVTGLTNQSQLVGIFSSKHLVAIDKFILCEENTPVSAFTDASALQNITIEGVIGNSINFQWCPLTLESAKSVINALKDYSGTTTTYSVTFSSTTKELLDAAGAIFNNMTWDAYLDTIGWIS